jgi:hypothetical protein
LVGAFTSVDIAVSIDGASSTDSVVHAIVTLSSDATGVSGTSINAETSGKVAVRLVGGFTTIEGTTSGDTGTRDAAQVLLTIVTTSGGRCTALVVGTRERSGANSKGSVALGLSGLRATIENTAVSIASASLARTIGLAIISSGTRTDSVVSARTADSSSGVTNLLSRGLTTIEGTAVSVGGTGKASSVSLAIGTSLSDAASVVGTSEGIGTDTVTGTALGLARLLTTIEGTAVSVGGTLDARTISLTVRGIEGRCEGTAISVGTALLARTGGNIADGGVWEGTSALSVKSARNACSSQVDVECTASVSKVGEIHADRSSGRTDGIAMDGSGGTLSGLKTPGSREGGDERGLITTLAGSRRCLGNSDAVLSKVVGRGRTLVREIGSISRLSGKTRVSVSAEIVISVGGTSHHLCASIASTLGGTSRDFTEREIGVTKAILVDLATAKTGGEAQRTIGSRRALRGV